jgi:Lrp/AsnC family leucine-responsive transcriptional regulator
MALRSERLLDDTAWRILDALQADSRLSFSALGRRVGLSAPAAAERVRRLEDAGIIIGYRVELGLEKLFPVTAIVRVSAPEEQCVPLGACVRELDGVLESYRVTGADRLILKIVAQSVAHLDEIIRALARFGTPTASIVLTSKSRPLGASARRR